MSLFPSDRWTKDVESLRGDMFIWARKKRDNTWALGLGYWNVSGGWSDAYGSETSRFATRFHPMPEPPPQ